LEPFEILERENGEVRFIAEDLGMLTDEVREMVAASGFPGMKILEFAFDGDDKNLYLPHNYEPNCIVYTGTHDNDTVLGWLKTIPESTKKHLDAYAGKIVTKAEDVIRLGMSSVAKICIIPMQDWLELDGSARVNTPNTLGENWKWRLLDGQMDDKTAGLMRRMTELYSRQP
jgi:4-alpha-glucanotransferase